MKPIRYLGVAIVFCLLMSSCKLYKDPPEINTQPVESSSTDATVQTDDLLASTGPDNKWEELLTYEEYLYMSSQDRADFADSFADSGKFFEWLQAVKEIYEQERTDDELGQDGVIDMDEINPNG